MSWPPVAIAPATPPRMTQKPEPASRIAPSGQARVPPGSVPPPPEPSPEPSPESPPPPDEPEPEQTASAAPTWASPTTTSSSGVPARDSSRTCRARCVRAEASRTCSSTRTSTTGPSGPRATASRCASSSAEALLPLTVRPSSSLAPSSRGRPATQAAAARATATRAPRVTVPTPGGSRRARSSTCPTAPTRCAAVAPLSGSTVVCADTVPAVSRLAGSATDWGRAGRPVPASAQVAPPPATTGSTAGLPATEAETVLARHCQAGGAAWALGAATAATARAAPAAASRRPVRDR